MAADLRRTAARPSLGLALSALSLCAAALYALLPLSYTYFGNPPFIRYAPNRVGMALRRTAPAAWYEKTWKAVSPGVPVVVTEGDITCQLTPASTAPGCAHPLVPGAFVSGFDKPLPEGAYRALVRVAAPPTCAGEVTLDVISPDFNLILTQVTTTLAAAAAQPQAIDFVVDEVAADRATIEVRVQQTSGPACASVEQVTLARRSS